MVGVLALVLGGLLVASIVFVIKTWIVFNDVTLTPFGEGALIVGTLFSLALGYGLMHLMYKSNKDGDDDNV